MKRREVKSKGEKERYKHLNVEFQRIARKDKKAFFRDQCKELEEYNRMGDYLLPHFREVFNYYLLKFSHGLSFCLFFWNSYVSNVGAFNIVPEVSEIVLISFN